MNAGRPSDHDKDLHEVEQHYRGLAQDEPPAMLDQAVLNKARLAVEPHPTRPWSFGWMHASATAAVLVIGLTLVLQQPDKVPIPATELNRSLPAAVERDLVDSEFRLQEELGRSNIETVDGLESADTKDADFGGFGDQPDAQIAADPVDNNEAKLNEPARRERAAKQKPAVLFEQEKPQQEQDHAEAASAPKESQGTSERQKSDKRMDQPVSDSGLIAPAPVSAPVTASEPEPALQKSEEGFAVTGQTSFDDAVGDEVIAGEDRVSDELAPEDRAAEDRVPEDRSALLGSKVTGARETSNAMRMISPDEWIEQILELKQAGDDDTWKQELETFLSVYPDYPLPKELSRELSGGQQTAEDPGGQ